MKAIKKTSLVSLLIILVTIMATRSDVLASGFIEVYEIDDGALSKSEC